MSAMIKCDQCGKMADMTRRSVTGKPPELHIGGDWITYIDDVDEPKINDFCSANCLAKSRNEQSKRDRRKDFETWGKSQQWDMSVYRDRYLLNTVEAGWLAWNAALDLEPKA